MGGMVVTVDVCCIITLDGPDYLRLANNAAVIRDDDIYGGGIMGFDSRMEAPILEYDRGRSDENFDYPNTVRLIIDNADGVLDAKLPSGPTNTRWVNRRVDIYTGGSKGDTLSSMAREFSGTIAPGGIQESITGKITLTLVDLREKHNVSFGGDSNINLTDWPNARDSDVGTTLPWVVGDFTIIPDDAGLKTWVVLDSSNGATGYVNVKAAATPMLTGSVAVFVNGILTTFTTHNPDDTITLTEAVHGDLTSSSNVITLRAIFYDTTDSGPASFEVTDVIEWLLTDVNYGNVSAGDIDAASFTTAQSLGDNFQVKHWKQGSHTIFDSVSQLAFEGGFDIFVNRSGEYVCNFFAPQILTPTATLGPHQVIDGTFTIKTDPDRIYCNRIEADGGIYNSDPHAAVVVEDTTEQADFGRILTKTYKYNWLYYRSNIETSLARKLFFWKRMQSDVFFSSPFEGDNEPVYSVFLNDSIRVTVWKFTDMDLFVRRVGVDIMSSKMNFRATNHETILDIGSWDGAVPTVPMPGYWNNAAGNAGGVPLTYWW